MLTCPACQSPFKATAIYAAVPATCACGQRVQLDAAGQAVDSRLGLTFGVVIVVATLGFAAHVWPLTAALAAIGVYTLFAVAARPALVRRRGRLVRFEG